MFVKQDVSQAIYVSAQQGVLIVIRYDFNLSFYFYLIYN